MRITCLRDRTTSFHLPREPLPGIEPGIRSDLLGILKGIEVHNLTQDGVRCLFTDAWDAEQQLLFVEQVNILCDMCLQIPLSPKDDSPLWKFLWNLGKVLLRDLRTIDEELAAWEIQVPLQGAN